MATVSQGGRRVEPSTFALRQPNLRVTYEPYAIEVSIPKVADRRRPRLSSVPDPARRT
jgi:hypothetical protein